MSGEGSKVIVAGGGVAALEFLLAFRSLAGSRCEIELIAPEEEFVYRALAVAEPFDLGEPRQVPLAAMAADAGAVHRRDAVASVEPDAGTVTTSSGEEVPFDALLLAPGATAREALPGAFTYRGGADTAGMRALLGRVASGEVGSIAFAAPPAARWSVPLYELALLSSAWLERQGVSGRSLTLVTHEPEPLALFGHRASESVAQLLRDAGVELIADDPPESFEAGRLTLQGGDSLEADAVVAMPRLEVGELPGVPQDQHGFIGTDAYMRVEGTDRVFAAGDATWFPIKQGGLAAQQADVAAGSVAALFDTSVEPAPLRPVLRGALLTGAAPRYLRAEIGDRARTSAAGAAPLWWPPSKVAGRHLAPYLAGGEEEDAPGRELADVEPLQGEDLAESEADHRAALDLALASADADARWRDFRGALRWLELAEQLNLTVPTDYTEKRVEWARSAELI